MAFLEKSLYIRKSTLPNAGNGLFTKVFIPKGTRIIEYKGKRTIWSKVKDDDGKNGYIFYITRNNVIDAFPTKQYLARYVNDARGFTKIKGIVNNCEYIIDGKRCFVEAAKDIPAGSELFVSYGAEYWQTMRTNAKIDKAETKKEAKTGRKASKKKTSKKKTSKKKQLKKKR